MPVPVGNRSVLIQKPFGCVHIFVQHANNEHLRLNHLIKNSMVLDLQSAIPRENVGIVGAE